jgi:hypothetical protein
MFLLVHQRKRTRFVDPVYSVKIQDAANSASLSWAKWTIQEGFEASASAWVGRAPVSLSGLVAMLHRVRAARWARVTVKLVSEYRILGSVGTSSMNDEYRLLIFYLREAFPGVHESLSQVAKGELPGGGVCRVLAGGIQQHYRLTGVKCPRKEPGDGIQFFL